MAAGNPCLDAALNYAARGWPVLPLKGKAPLTSHGVKEAIVAQDAIRTWWERWPDANVGIATGEAAGVFVLDVDPRAGGDDSLAALEVQHGELPPTPAVITGGGGRHLYFRHTPGISCRNGIMTGLDVKSDGGYVVSPPSVHPDTGFPYEWDGSSHPDDVPIADAPNWLLDLIRGGADRRGAAPAPELPAVIPEGKRNATLTSLAGTMRRRGMGEQAILAALKEENSTRCRPPLPNDELQAVAHSISRYDPADGGRNGRNQRAISSANQTQEEDKEAAAPVDKRTVSQVLLDIASEAELFHDPDGAGYAQITVDGHRETWPVRSRGFSGWLRSRFFKQTGKAAGGQAFTDAIATVEAQALYTGTERTVHLRVAEHGGRYYVDLCDAKWRAVEIGADKWKVITDSPVAFVRYAAMQPLPCPIPGGSLDQLRPFVNADDDGFSLVVAWLAMSLKPRGPYPILAVTGPQGSGKSTLARVLRRLIDPNTADVRATPKEEHDLLISSRNGWVQAFDNISGLKEWLSDGLCRLSTGSGLATRKLYSDAEEEIFNAQRPVLLNGITDLVTRPDAADRAMVVVLGELGEPGRQGHRDEAAIWTEFEQARPGILGALLDAAVCGLKNAPAVKLERLPRMADFARWVVACEPALPWPAGEFLKVYGVNRREGQEASLALDDFASCLLGAMDCRMEWEGTASELLELAAGKATDAQKRAKSWPINGRSASGHLKRIAPMLLAVAKLKVDRGREGKGRTRKILITRVGDDLRPHRPPEPETDATERKKTVLWADAKTDNRRTQTVPADAKRTQTPPADDRLTQTGTPIVRPEMPAGIGSSGVADDADDKLPLLSTTGGNGNETRAAIERRLAILGAEIADMTEDMFFASNPEFARKQTEYDELCKQFRATGGQR